MSAPTVRRVVTGHSREGRAVIASDEIRTGLNPVSTLIWTTDTSPADNTDETDGGARRVGVTLEGGTVFRFTRFEAGHRSPMHRTRSTDYAIVLEGEIVLELDDGERVRIRSGDVVVQRGTNHAWVNDTRQACLMAFVLVDAKAVEIDGHILEPTLVSFASSPDPPVTG